jgi:hypothetical protein
MHNISMKSKRPDSNNPVILQRREKQRFWLRWRGKKYGPWDNLDRSIRYSPDGKHWAVRGKLHGRYYVLVDGARYGPFDGYVEGPVFDEERGFFVFAAMRNNEFLLVAGGRVMRRGKIVEKPGEGKYVCVGKDRHGPYYGVWSAQFSLQGGRWAAIASREGEGQGFYLLLDGRESGPFTELEPRGEFSPTGSIFFCRELFGDDSRTLQNIVINGERVYGPCEAPFIHYFSPDGKRWMVHAKRDMFEGIVVDGREYGNYPFPRFIFDFSPDSRHWCALVGRGKKDMIVIDGKEYGTYELKAPDFTEDSRFVAYFRRGDARWVFFDGREVGPYRYKSKKRIHIEDAILADLVFIKKGKKTVRRCVISIDKENGNGRILFSPRTGETLKQAIEIVNADETGEGIAAEHRYVSLVYESRGQTYTLLEQQLIHRGEKSYDRLKVQLDSGKERDFYFDISSFYGRFTPQLELLIKKKPE